MARWRKDTGRQEEPVQEQLSEVEGALPGAGAQGVLQTKPGGQRLGRKKEEDSHGE